MITIKLIPNAHGDVGFAIEHPILVELGWELPCDVLLTVSESSPGLLIVEPLHRLVDPPPADKTPDSEPSAQK